MVRRQLSPPFGDVPGDLVRPGRLVDLRRHRRSDREAFAAWYGDPEIADLLRHDLRPLPREQALDYFDTIVLPSSASGTAWAIHLRADNALIGTTAVTQIDQVHSSCLFRIVIGNKDAWGHGFGTEATRLVAEEVFTSLELDTLRLEVFNHNPRAIATYRKVGFEEVGRSVEWVRGRRLDIVEMHLSRAQWQGSLLTPGVE